MAPLPPAKQNPPAASSQPIALLGTLLARIAPTVANESATRPCPTAPSRSPPDRTVTRLIATKTTDTTHVAQAATACQRAGRARLIVLPNARWVELLGEGHRGRSPSTTGSPAGY